jgi:hypothetical protein
VSDRNAELAAREAAGAPAGGALALFSGVSGAQGLYFS